MEGGCFAGTGGAAYKYEAIPRLPFGFKFVKELELMDLASLHTYAFVRKIS
jgi:hypothetical protein